MSRRMTLVALATAVTCAAAAPAAQAEACVADDGSVNRVGLAPTGLNLLDTAGFTWDLQLGSDPESFASVNDGYNDALERGDSYDDLGAVSINDPDLGAGSEATYRGSIPEVGVNPFTYGYWSGDAAGCSFELDGRQVAFPAATVQGVEVQRRWYVPATGPRGARLLTSVRNPSDEPRTVAVFVQGNLGSDSNTTLLAEDDADATWTAADRWAVTGDRATGSFGDPVVSHLVDGAGGADRVDATALDGDDVRWEWKDITLAPGAQTSILSYEALTALAPAAPGGEADRDAEIAAAREIVAQLDALSPAERFAGLTAAQIAGVRNWQRPATTASIEGPGEATAGDAIRLVAQTDGTLSTCTVTHAWKVDDGPAGSDATLSPTLSAGEHTVTLTATSACGTTATATKTIKIAARPADAPKAAPAVVTLGGLAQGAQTRNGQPSLSGRAGTAPGDAPTVTVRIFEVSARVRAVAAQASSFAPGRLVEVQQVPVVNGTWTAKPVTALLPGRYQAIAEQGNVSGAVTRSVPIAFSVLGRCQSRRAFDLHLLRVKGGYGRLTVELNGRPLKVRGERRPVVHVDLKGMPKGKQVVRISAKTAGGRMLKSVRTFRTCAGALA